MPNSSASHAATGSSVESLRIFADSRPDRTLRRTPRSLQVNPLLHRPLRHPLKRLELVLQLGVWGVVRIAAAWFLLGWAVPGLSWFPWKRFAQAIALSAL
jgi:hypothetical protein